MVFLSYNTDFTVVTSDLFRKSLDEYPICLDSFKQISNKSEVAIILKETKEKIYNKKAKDIYYPHCTNHIVNKAETSLVETKNGSLRGHMARFIRKTKAFGKNFESLCNRVTMWVYMDMLIGNRMRYASYCYGEEDYNEFVYNTNTNGNNKNSEYDKNNIISCSEKTEWLIKNKKW